MQKTIIGFFIIVTIFSCKKDNSSAVNNNNSNIPADGWRIGSTTYSYNSCIRYNTSSLKAYSTDGSLFIAFSALPTTSGTYGIVNSGSGPVSANQISFGYLNSVGYYKSKTTTSVAATVNVTNGIITVTIPETDVDLLGATYKFAARVYEK